MRQVIQGKVFAVADGDTVQVLTPYGDRIKVRLDGLDANEEYQPGFRAAKRALESKVLGREVKLEVKTVDKYKRHVARISLSGGEDVNLWMIHQGHAIYYRKYKPGGPQSAQYARAQEEAARALRGRWKDPNDLARVVPETWRHQYLYPKEKQGILTSFGARVEKQLHPLIPPPGTKTATQYRAWLRGRVNAQDRDVIGSLRMLSSRDLARYRGLPAEMVREAQLLNDRLYKSRFYERFYAGKVRVEGPGGENTALVSLAGIDVPAALVADQRRLAAWLVRVATARDTSVDRYTRLRVQRALREMVPGTRIAGATIAQREAFYKAWQILYGHGRIPGNPGDVRVFYKGRLERIRNLSIRELAKLADRDIAHKENKGRLVADREDRNYYARDAAERYLRQNPSKARQVQEYFEVGGRASPADTRGSFVRKLRVVRKKVWRFEGGRWVRKEVLVPGYAEEKGNRFGDRDVSGLDSGFAPSDRWPNMNYHPQAPGYAGKMDFTLEDVALMGRQYVSLHEFRRGSYRYDKQFEPEFYESLNRAEFRSVAGSRYYKAVYPYLQKGPTGKVLDNRFNQEMERQFKRMWVAYTEQWTRLQMLSESVVKSGIGSLERGEGGQEMQKVFAEALSQREGHAFVAVRKRHLRFEGDEFEDRWEDEYDPGEEEGPGPEGEGHEQTLEDVLGYHARIERAGREGNVEELRRIAGEVEERFGTLRTVRQTGYDKISGPTYEERPEATGLGWAALTLTDQGNTYRMFQETMEAALRKRLNGLPGAGSARLMG